MNNIPQTGFKKAERRAYKPKIAITGPSGSGKTMSALLIAAGLGGRIAVIDTENGSASLYADAEKPPMKGIEFDVLEIDPPYTMDKYLSAMDAAQAAGYSVLIMDSISHAWAGEGGLLDKKSALDARGGNQNSYTTWATITPEHERFKARILSANISIIATMRSKQDYVLEKTDNGKNVPKKVGMAPVQREGMEYEFMIVFDLAMDHTAAASKDRTSMFDGTFFKPTKKTGEQIRHWLENAKQIPPPAAAPAPVDPVGATAESLDTIEKLRNDLIMRGIKAATISKGIDGELTKNDIPHSPETPLSAAAAACEIAYLTRWIGHIESNRPSPAASTPNPAIPAPAVDPAPAAPAPVVPADNDASVDQLNIIGGMVGSLKKMGVKESAVKKGVAAELVDQNKTYADGRVMPAASAECVISFLARWIQTLAEKQQTETAAAETKTKGGK